MLNKNTFFYLLGVLVLSYVTLSITLPDAIYQILEPIFDKQGIESIIDRTLQVFMISLIAVGVTIDIIGSKRGLITGIILVLLGNLLFGQSDSLSEALVGRGLIGAGAAFSWISIITLYAKNFSKSYFVIALASIIAVDKILYFFSNSIFSFLLGHSPWRHFLYALCPPGILIAITAYLVLMDIYQSNEESSRLSDIQRVFINSSLWSIGLILAGGLFAIHLFSDPMGIASIQQLLPNHSERVVVYSHYFEIFAGFGAIFVGLITYKVHKYRLLLITGYGFAAISITILLYLENLSPTIIKILFIVLSLFLSTYVICYKFVRNLFRTHSLASAYSLVSFIAFLGITALSTILDKSLHDIISSIPIGDMHIFVSNDIRTTLTVVPVILIINIIMITCVKIKSQDDNVKRLQVPVAIRSELMSYWAGRQPLGRTFWGLHILGSIIVSFMIAAVLIAFNIYILPEYFASIKIMILPYSILTAICVWRAAERQTLNKMLKNFVRSIVVLDFTIAIFLLGRLLLQFVPLI